MPPDDPRRTLRSRLFYGAAILIALVAGVIALRGYLAMREADEALRNRLDASAASAGGRTGEYTAQSLALQERSERLDARRTFRLHGEPTLVRCAVGEKIGADLPLVNAGRMPVDDIRLVWAFAVAAGETPVSAGETYRDSVRRFDAIYPGERFMVRLWSQDVLTLEDSLGCATGRSALSVRGFLVAADATAGQDTLEFDVRRVEGTDRLAGWLRPRKPAEQER